MSITGIILNWKRKNNVNQILSSWKQSGFVTQAFVWNNNKNETFTHHWAKVINSNEDLGLYTRYMPALLAKNDCILIQDDDLIIQPDNLKKLYNYWQKQNQLIHGIFGRNINLKGHQPYCIDFKDQEVDFVLTRVLVSNKKNFQNFFLYKDQFQQIQKHGIPYGNGQDIILNYVSRKLHGKRNKVHKIQVLQLPDEHAISRGESHYSHRQKLIRFCNDWLISKKQKYINNDSQIVIHSIYSESHKPLCKKYLLTSIPERFTVISKQMPQVCPTGTFQEHGWADQVKIKMNYIVQSLKKCQKENKIFVYLDSDIVIVDKNAFNVMIEQFNKGDAQIAFQADQYIACTGCIMAKPTYDIIRLFQQSIKLIPKYNRDQYPVNQILKNTNTKFTLFSSRIWNYSHYEFKKGLLYEGNEIIKFPKQTVLIHGNYTLGLQNKIKILEQAMQFKLKKELINQMEQMKEIK